jgi:copper chaperone
MKAGRSRSMTTRLVFNVPDMSCANCEAAVSGAVSQVRGVERVVVDLDAKSFEVWGEDLDDAAIRVAIDDAGYDVLA